jgi:hypothetical protein
MTAKKGWGSTVLGWFVVDESAPETSAGAETGADPAPPAAPGPSVQFVEEPPAAPGGQVDFAGVYKAAGIDDEEQGRVSRASDLLRALPEGTDDSVKKRIVETSLKSFGVPIDKIIEAGAGEIQALEGYIRKGGADTEKLLDESRNRIAQFEGEIGRIKKVMDDRVAEQLAVVKACNGRKLEIQSVLEFFGQERVARVVRDSPKLVEPETAPSASASASPRKD